MVNVVRIEGYPWTSLNCRQQEGHWCIWNILPCTFHCLCSFDTLPFFANQVVNVDTNANTNAERKVRFCHALSTCTAILPMHCNASYDTLPFANKDLSMDTNTDTNTRIQMQIQIQLCDVAMHFPPALLSCQCSCWYFTLCQSFTIKAASPSSKSTTHLVSRTLAQPSWEPQRL